MYAGFAEAGLYANSRPGVSHRPGSATPATGAADVAGFDEAGLGRDSRPGVSHRPGSATPATSPPM